MNEKIKSYLPFALLIFLAMLVFANNDRVTLWDQDESAYAGFALNMYESGNWVIPEFMWSDVHRKPPLHFWNIAVSYHLFGVNEFSIRFPSAFFVLLTYILMYFAGRELWGKRIALISVAVLSTSLLVPSLAKVAVTDSTLLFFSTLCAFSILFILKKKSWWWTIAFWSSFSLALLTKGPPVIIFTAVFIGILLLRHPDRKNLVSLHPWFFLPLAAAPLFLWAYFTAQKDGGQFITWMIDWYILKRVDGGVFGQTGPPGIHLLGILLFFLPYSMFFPQAFWAGIKDGIRGKGENFLLGAWFIAGWLIYEISPSKLPAYVIAAHIPLAVLIAKGVAAYMTEGKRPPTIFMSFHFILMGLLASGLLIAPFIWEINQQIRWTCLFSGAILLIGTVLMILHTRSSYFTEIMIGVNLVFQVSLWCILLPETNALKDSSKSISRYIERNAAKESVILIANDHGRPPSLPFYLKTNFVDIKEEYNTILLWEAYQSNIPYVLILNTNQKNEFLEKRKNLNFKEIVGQLTDRNEKSAYYILINPAAHSLTAQFKPDPKMN